MDSFPFWLYSICHTGPALPRCLAGNWTLVCACKVLWTRSLWIRQETENNCVHRHIRLFFHDNNAAGILNITEASSFQRCLILPSSTRSTPSVFEVRECMWGLMCRMYGHAICNFSRGPLPQISFSLPNCSVAKQARDDSVSDVVLFRLPVTLICSSDAVPEIL